MTNSTPVFKNDGSGHLNGTIGHGKVDIPQPQSPPQSQPNEPTKKQTIDPSEIKIIKIRQKLDTSRPFPQANSLAKVSSVVDAVSGNADTDEGIALAIGVVGRQGSYYANAAAYLGLLQEAGGSPRSWALTAQGIDFLNAKPIDRVKVLTGLVAQMPAALATLDDDGTAESEVANTQSLSDSTASRRVATLNSWLKVLTSSKAEEELTLEYEELRQRLPEASLAVAEARSIRIANAESKPAVICDRCYMAKSASGVCSCD